MNGAHLHLLLNHLPVLGSLFSLCWLIYGLCCHEKKIILAALISLVIAAASSVPAYLTGEEAEHVVEPIVGINQQALDSHEDMAEIAWWTLLMSGAMALGTLTAARKKPEFPLVLGWVNAVLLALAFVLMARTAYLGGHIRHSEIGIQQAGTETTQADDD